VTERVGPLPGTHLTEEEVGRFHTPQGAPDGYVYEDDVVYGTAGAGGRPLLTHLYRPIEPGGPRPAVVFVHGGGWAGGHPFMHIRMAERLAGEGYVAACPHYRLSGEAPWPAALEDAKCAVRWMRANAERLGVDPDRIGVCGGSAGGHLSALVAFTPGRFEGTGGHADQRSDVAAAALLYPATDLSLPFVDRVATADLLHHIGIFLAGADTREVDPVTYVSPAAPPVLTLTGDVDGAVPLRGVERLHAALDDAGVPNELVVYEGRNHAFDFQPHEWIDTADRFSAFFAQTLRAGQALASGPT
jgi:acetyl esterase